MTTAKSSRATRNKASTRKVSSRAARGAGSRSSSQETSATEPSESTSTSTSTSKATQKSPEAYPTPEEDPIPEGVKKLVDLFQGPLQSVNFPDVDREILEERCDALRDADADVRRLFSDLEAAQDRLNGERSALEKCAERGLAYAQVFAVGDEELIAKLGEISLGSGKKGVRKQKARVPKAQKAATPPPSPTEEAKVENTEMSADELVETEFVIDEDSTKISA
ncbi:MAG: hypothetical protein KTR25_14470 [Myxococcales bacterium]|nr:hypothetical protein [Myxococcales bacterium]